MDTIDKNIFKYYEEQETETEGFVEDQITQKELNKEEESWFFRTYINLHTIHNPKFRIVFFYELHDTKTYCQLYTRKIGLEQICNFEQEK
jgi:hypothetical protein